MQNTLNERGVAITRNALSAGGQTFSMRDIREVRIITVRKDKAVPLVISLAGLATTIVGLFYRSAAGIVIGLMLVVVGVLNWMAQDVTHRLMITTSDGEHEALASLELEFVERVEQTLRFALETATPANTPR